MSRLSLLCAVMAVAVAVAVGCGATGCYVAPAVPPSQTPAPPAQCTDIDGDGYCADIDCNDQNSSVHPNAPDAPDDGIDQNCDGYP